jgi:hypothetical protein
MFGFMLDNPAENDAQQAVEVAERKAWCAKAADAIAELRVSSVAEGEALLAEVKADREGIPY